MNKKTLYITFDGLTDPLGQSQILPYLTGINTNGYEITVLSCEKKEQLKSEKNTVLELIRNTNITWHYIIYDEDGGFLSRYLYLKKLGKLAKKLHAQNKFQLIHCRSYLSSLIGLKFKLKYNIPFVFDMRGLWADERIDGGIWNKNKLLHRTFFNYFKKKEKQFIKYSNAIVSLTNNGADELSKLYPKVNSQQKITIIPCCCNTQLFNKDVIEKEIKLHTIFKNDHILIYTGSIGTWYFTKEMIDCILVWKNYIPNIKLLIVTKDLEALTSILNNYPSDILNTIITTSSSYYNIPNYLNMAKAAIFFIKPSYSKIASSPTKMAECWAMNLPIITNAGIGDNDLYFKDNQGGILIDDFTSFHYENACKTYLQLNFKSNNYRNIALNYFDTNMAITKYVQIYDSLTNKN